jgi:hypothetical protein
VRRWKFSWLYGSSIRCFPLSEEFFDGESRQAILSSNETPLFYLIRYSSIWDASDVAEGRWAGKATYKNKPYYFQLKGVSASGDQKLSQWGGLLPAGLASS